MEVEQPKRPLQKDIFGGEESLGEVNIRHEKMKRVTSAVEAGEDRQLADRHIVTEMAVERLSEAFGGVVVEWVDPDSLGLPS